MRTTRIYIWDAKIFPHIPKKYHLFFVGCIAICTLVSTESIRRDVWTIWMDICRELEYVEKRTEWKKLFFFIVYDYIVIPFPIFFFNFHFSREI